MWPFPPRWPKQVSGTTGLLRAHLQCGQTLVKGLVDECAIRYHKCLGPALRKIVFCRMWPFCPMTFMLGTGFQSIFEIWPAATSWPRAAGVPQPFAGAQLWLVAARSCSWDGRWNAGMRNSSRAAGKPWSVMLVWRALSCGGSPLWAAGTLRGDQELGMVWVPFGEAWIQGAAWGRLSSDLCPACRWPQLPLSLGTEGAATVGSHHSSHGRTLCVGAAWLELSWKAGDSVFGGAVLGLLVWERCGGVREQEGGVGPWDGGWGAEENSVRGSWGKSWVSRSRTRVPTRGRGTPTEGGHGSCG